MAKVADPTAVREQVRAFALGLPGAVEEFPWGESVIKVNKKVFVFLGVDDGSHPPGVTLKLKDPEAHAHALTAPGAEPAGYGLGKSGWVRVPLAEQGAPCGRAALRLGGGVLSRHSPQEAHRRARRGIAAQRQQARKGP